MNDPFPTRGAGCLDHLIFNVSISHEKTQPFLTACRPLPDSIQLKRTDLVREVSSAWLRRTSSDRPCRTSGSTAQSCRSGPSSPSVAYCIWGSALCPCEPPSLGDVTHTEPIRFHEKALILLGFVRYQTQEQILTAEVFQPSFNGQEHSGARRIPSWCGGSLAVC
jgi:hypothetical protein